MSITGCVFARSPKPALSTLSEAVITLKAISECCLFCALVSPTQRIQKGTGLFDSVYFIAGERLCLSCCVCQLIFELRVPIKTKHHTRRILPLLGSFKSHIESIECGSNLVVAQLFFFFLSVSRLVMFLFTLDFHLFTHSSLFQLISYTTIITFYCPFKFPKNTPFL